MRRTTLLSTKLGRSVAYVTLLAALPGCVTSVVEPAGVQVHSFKINLREVQIMAEPPSRPYDVIGQVTAYADYYDKESVLDRELRRQAAKLGADAIIKRSAAERYSGVFTAGSRSQGLAIRYKPQSS